MTTCEVCGKEAKLLRASIEGTEMNVCEACSRYGKVLYVPPEQRIRPKETKSFSREPEPEEKVVENFATLIRKAREKSSLNQEDFAKMLNEKLSVMRSIENNSFVPGIELAKKLEKKLNLKFVETVSEEQVSIDKGGSREFTLGDMVTIKKRKQQ